MKYSLKLTSYLPSLATSCENMASNSERIMERSRNFQRVHAGRKNLRKHCTTDHARGIMKQWGSPTTFANCRGTISPSLPLSLMMWYRSALLGECRWDQASSRKQSQCGRHGLSNILKVQTTLLYSVYKRGSISSV